MNLKRLIAFSPLVVLVLLALVFGFYSLGHDPKVKPDALVGKPVPQVLVGQDGTQKPLAQALPISDKPILINVFASWCTPCAVEHPDLVALKDQGVVIVGLAYKDKPENTKAYLDRLGNPYQIQLTDPKGTAGIELGISGVPETYVVNREGVITYKLSGPITKDTIRDLKAALAAKN